MASYARSFLGFLLVLLCSLSLVYGLGICAFGVYLAVRSSSGLQDLNTTCAGADSGSFFNCSLAPSTPHKSGDHLPIPGFTLGVIVLGAIVVFINAFGICGGRSKNRCLLFFFAFLDFLLLLAEATIAIIFIIPSTKGWIDAIICNTGLTPADVKALGTFLFCYERVAGYVLIGIGGLQLLSFITAAVLRSVARESKEEYWERTRKDQTELLIGGSQRASKKTPRSTKGRDATMVI